MNKIKVKNERGRTTEIELSLTESVGNLKKEIFSKLQVPSENQKLIFQGNVLQNAFSIKDCNIKDGDTVICLVGRRPESKQIKSQESPTKELIREATVKAFGNGQKAKRKPDRAFPDSSVAARLTRQLQELMGGEISNTQSNDQSNDQSEKNDEEENEEEDSELLDAPVADQELLQRIKEFGFKEEHGTKALILNHNNLELAMEWLLQHAEDTDIDEPIAPQTLRHIALRQPRNLAPDASVVKRFVDMGFTEEDVSSALRATHNNPEAAMSWLLGEREQVESEGGIALDSVILRAILSNPTIQQGLSNPRVQQALRNMLENPSSAEQYLLDPEVGPILAQVGQIIHRE